MGFRASALVALLLLPVTVWGQTLAEKVPADAMLYVGWKGSDALGAAYDQSHLKAILDGTDLSMLGSDAFAKSLGDLVGREDPQLGQQLPALLGAGKELLQYPTALYVSRGAQGMPALALIVDAGANAGVLANKLKAGPAGQPPLTVAAYGKLVVLSFGTDDRFVALVGGPAQAAPAPSLAADAAFQAAMKQVDAKGVCLAYCNTQSLMATMQAMSDPQGPQQQRPVVALGLDQLGAVAVSGDLAGKDWATRVFLAAPAPRKGLLKLMDGGPLSMDLLKVIPQSATFVSVGQFDLAGLMDEARASVQRFDPGMVAAYDRTLAQASQMAGADLRADLAGSLGKEWAIYGDPSTVGNSLTGWVFINRPANAAKADATLSKIERSLAAMGTASLRQGRMVVPLYQKQYGKTMVHCFAFPMISPSWAIRDGVLYLGFYPQSVVAAADFAASGKPGFAANERFVAAKAELGSAPASFSYCDLPRTAPGSYSTVVLLSRYAGFADLFGLRTPMMTVPPLPTLLAHLSPASSYSWNDAAGWHMRSRSPFPGSELLAGNFEANPAVMQAPVMMSILLPSLTRARETANRVKCANNMRQIGLAIALYSNENKGKYPEDLGTLVLEEGISAEVFTCPSMSGASLPRGATPQEMAEWVNENSQFVYLGAGLTSSAPSEQPVLYEPLEHHGGDGANVLFADAHVEFVTPATLRQLLEGTGAKAKK